MVRLNTLAAAALAAGAISASASSSSTTPLRGVAPADAAKYTPTKNAQGQLRWKCLDGSKELSFSAVNDDYCDCPDGSDEPGTSACPNSTFYCANHGHIPAYIRSSRVDDGICDPECCDGSDESDGKVHCPDRCAKVGKEYRKKKAELENLRRAGAKIRDKYIADGRKEKESLQAEIAKLEVEVQVATENEARLKNKLTRAETSDKDVIDAKVKTPLYAKLVDHQTAIKALQDKNAALKAELSTLTLLLDDLAKGYNPNYQDMAVKGAVVAYKEWRGIASAASDAKEEEADADSANTVDQLAAENTKLTQLLDEGDWPSAKLSALLSDDPLDVMDRGLGGAAHDKRVYATESDGGLLFRIHEYLPDGVVPYFEAMVDTLLDVLIKANVITDVKRMRPKSAASNSADEPENVSAARRAHTDAANHLSRTSQELSTRQHRLAEFATRYGRDAEFKALENKCFTKDIGEYTYEYCFFGRATQIPNNGGAQISLGTFTQFNPRQDSRPEQDDYWLQQIYARGQKCWNGPERSAIVDLECGVENKVLDVFEAEKCIYSIKVATPAVCFAVKAPQAGQAAAGDHQVKDEL
ncbi:related to alpha glucosidase II beta subunit [Sporisorium reilianum SRZ2]|uniref:Glucosidase 2 subunit beta n=1 Tax=Sporisorium reilianum (strain SRZ2) TaxID=999809 RepID=E6ZWL6_SPORE|nr:related to alpha glucosidase II beta subunit [Sporisorium reilianum SRZ2]